MAITIQGPDGASIDFPDGTPEPEINAAMAKAYPHPNADPGFAANAVRALASGANPFQDRLVAIEKTLLPQSMGGSPGFDYGANLEAERAANQQLREQHPNLANLGQGTGAALSSLAVPAAALGPLAEGTGAIGRMALGGAAGEGIGAVQGLGAAPNYTNLPQTAQSTLQDANMGGALGAAFPAVGSAVNTAVRPFQAGAVDPARQALVEALQRSGINPTAGQITGNKTLQKIEAGISDLPFAGGGAEQKRIENNAAFTGALMKEAGLPGVTDASPDSLKKAHRALGDQFNALGDRNAVVQDPQLTQELDAALQNYHDVTPVSMRAPGIEKVISDIKNPGVTAAQGEVPFEAPFVSGAAPARETAPTSMLDFLRRNGGVQDEGGDLASMGFSNLRGVASRGSNKIINKAGLPMDEARRAAVDAGYLEPHETVSDFINKIGEHPTYSVHDEQAVARLNARNERDYGPSGEPEPAPPGASDMFPGDMPSAGPMIPGDQYNNLRSQLGKTAQRLKTSDPMQAQAFREVQGALDSAMERSIAKNNPDDLGAFQAIRRQYGNLLSIEHAAGAAGEGSALGQVTPALMRTALATAGNRRSYARGIGDLAPLTNAGNAILTNFPQSGTTPRALAARLLGVPTGIAELGVGGLAAGIPGAVAGVTVPALAGRTIMSGPVQSLLARQLGSAPRPNALASPASARAMLAATLAANRQQLQNKQSSPP